MSMASLYDKVGNLGCVTISQIFPLKKISRFRDFWLWLLKMTRCWRSLWLLQRGLRRTARFARLHPSLLALITPNQKYGVKKKNVKKKLNSKIFWKKKNRENFFSFEFSKKISVEIFHLMSRLRIQNFTITGQGVPEIRGVTDGHTHTHKLF